MVLRLVFKVHFQKGDRLMTWQELLSDKYHNMYIGEEDVVSVWNTLFEVSDIPYRLNDIIDDPLEFDKVLKAQKIHTPALNYEGVPFYQSVQGIVFIFKKFIPEDEVIKLIGSAIRKE